MRAFVIYQFLKVHDMSTNSRSPIFFGHKSQAITFQCHEFKIGDVSFFFLSDNTGISNLTDPQEARQYELTLCTKSIFQTLVQLSWRHHTCQAEFFFGGEMLHVPFEELHSHEDACLCGGFE